MPTCLRASFFRRGGDVTVLAGTATILPGGKAGGQERNDGSRKESWMCHAKESRY